jgi:peptidoglycan/xylan/chitin deacetylase (PgdA/CDA1 family)
MTSLSRAMIVFSVISILLVPSWAKWSKPAEKALDNTHVVVLCYHHLDLKSKTPFNISSDNFKKQLDLLTKNGFSFISLKDVEAYYYNKKPIPARSVVITFDDGNLNTYTLAYPILKARKIPFVVFVYPTATYNGHKLGFMNWKEVKELADNGVEIGSHAYYHPYMTDYKKQKDPEAWLKLQLTGSKEYIEKQIGKPVNYFALPFGLTDAKVQESIKNAGYKLSFNVDNANSGPTSEPFYLNRWLVVKGDPLTAFESKLLAPAK